MIKSLNDAPLISEIYQYLIKEGFIEGAFNDCYSDAKSLCLYHKRLINNTGNEDYYTAIITKNEVAIEREYSYGGGNSAGHWLYEENDFESFSEAYNNLVDVAIKLKTGEC